MDFGLLESDGREIHERGRFSELILPRLQLFEFHDMAWFPPTLRLGTIESLRVLAEMVELAETVAPLVRQTLQQTGTQNIVDLCSGSCGPLVALSKRLELESRRIDVVATDRYPSPAAFRQASEASGGAIRGYSQPVDARRVPGSLKGMRTLFNAFHHFPADEARAILKDAHDSRQPIGVFEIYQPIAGPDARGIPGKHPAGVVRGVAGEIARHAVPVFCTSCSAIYLRVGRPGVLPENVYGGGTEGIGQGPGRQLLVEVRTESNSQGSLQRNVSSGNPGSTGVETGNRRSGLKSLLRRSLR